MKRYITEDIDYTGCDPVIAAFLKDGKKVKCLCRDFTDGGVVDRWVIGYSANEKSCYITDCGNFRFAEPIEQKRKAKTLVEIAQWLRDNNYVCNGKGEWVWVSNIHHAMPVYPSYLFCYCDREIPDGVFFPEEWLAE